VPVLPGRGRGLDRAFDLGGVAAVHRGEDVILVVRHHRRERVAGADLLAADDEWDLDLLRAHLLEAHLELRALGRAGCIRLDRLVVRLRRSKESGRGAHWRRL
jgi:hypothetical protein